MMPIFPQINMPFYTKKSASGLLDDLRGSRMTTWAPKGPPGLPPQDRMTSNAPGGSLLLHDDLWILRMTSMITRVAYIVFSLHANNLFSHGVNAGQKCTWFLHPFELVFKKAAHPTHRPCIWRRILQTRSRMDAGRMEVTKKWLTV